MRVLLIQIELRFCNLRYRECFKDIKSVSSDFKTPRNGSKNEAQPSSFKHVRDDLVEIDEILFRVFDIASQSIEIPWRN